MSEESLPGGDEILIDPEAGDRRALLGLLGGGTAVGTAEVSGTLHWFAASRAVAVSDDPALVALALPRGSRGAGAVRRAGLVALSIPAAGTGERLRALYAGGECPAGAPGFAVAARRFRVPADAHGWLCARLVEVLPTGGDRDLFLLEVSDASRAGGPPAALPPGLSPLDLS